MAPRSDHPPEDSPLDVGGRGLQPCPQAPGLGLGGAWGLLIWAP